MKTWILFTAPKFEKQANNSNEKAYAGVQL